MNRPLHITILTDGVSPLVMGGMQKHSSYLVQYLVQAGVVVDLYHPGKESVSAHWSIELSEQISEYLVDFPQGGGMPWSYLQNNFKYSQGLYHRFETEGRTTDFIYAQGFTAWYFLDRKRKGQSLPPIGVNFHGLEMFQQAQGFKQKLIQYMFRGPVKFNLSQADVAYSLGTGLTQLMLDHRLAEKTAISEINIGLDSSWSREEPKKFDPEELAILFIGRYERRKGIEELNTVIRQSNEKKVSFHFVGPIPESKKLPKDMATYNGRVTDESQLKDIIDSCHVLIVPSYSEGMPTVILEAMSRGLLVIASDVGAVSDVVDGQMGRLVKPGSVPGIQQALSEIARLSSKELQEMSVHAQKRFSERFTWESVIEKTLHDIRFRFQL